MMFFGRGASALLLLALLPLAGIAQAPLPDGAALMRGLRASARFDYEIQEQFTYVEQRRDIKISRLGKVTTGPMRTFEVHPSATPGRTWKRLIAIDGVPLDPAELARNDAEHAKHLREMAERERTETPAERAKRLRELDEARRERDAIMEDGFAVFEPTVLGRELHNGQPVLAVALTPRRDAQVKTREGSWLKEFEGRMLVSEPDYQLAALELRAIDDVSIGWGFVGRVHEGSRFTFTRRRVDGAWLPAEVVFEATGRTLLFRRFQLRATTTYSAYRRR